MSRTVVDTRFLLCPTPVLRLQERVNELVPGALIEVICTDPGCLYDIPAWCKLQGHQILDIRTQEHTHIILLEVGPQ
ncbi:hypothetical protein TI04_01515 [Achromatium sp. WMS2]|nr:hypothetical protein TI04_01515 [Achromatium sp. WMS2]